MLAKVATTVLVMSLLAVPTAATAVPAEPEIASRAADRCTIAGTPGDDVLRGTDRADVICGRGGDDRIVGNGGDDVLRGGGGNDVLVGGDGDDELVGGRGNDVLRAVDAPRFRDLVACGQGRDSAAADRSDRVQASCEDVDQDRAPTGISLAPSAIAENQEPGTVVGALTARDPDGGPHVFALVAGVGDAGNGSFRIVEGSLVATQGLDHEETPALEVRIRATDATGLAVERSFTVDVTDVDEPAEAVDDAATVLEDSGATAIDVLGNDMDVDDGPRSIGSVTQPAHGTVAITGGGTGLTYRPAPDFCGTASAADVFTYTLEPGGSTATVRVDVTCVDDGPVATDDSITVLEDSAATPIPVLGNDSFPGGGTLSIASVTQPDDGTVVVTGGGSGLTYTPDADACTGSGTPDRFTYSLVGGATASVRVTVTCVADAPVLATSSGTTPYDEGDPATAVDPALTLADVDADGAIAGATVEITGGLSAGEDVLALAGTHPGITASYAAGTLTLDGDATAAAYRAALRDVTYRNTSDAPSTADRTLTFEVTDHASLTDADTKTVSVAAVNDAPVLAPATGTVSHTEGEGATTLAGTLAVTDADDPTLDSATVVISSGRQVGDDLVFAGTAAVSGAYTAGTGTLVLTPAGATATVAEFQAALRTVEFDTANDDPTASRTIEVTADDGTDASDAATRTVTITPVNDPPVVTSSGGTVTATEDDASGTVVDAGLSVSDADDAELTGATVTIGAGRETGDSLTFADQPGITGGTYDAIDGTLVLSGNATVEDYRDALRTVRFVVGSQDPSAGARTVTFTVDDGTATATSSGKAVAVQPVNDAPVNTVPGTQVIAEGDSLTFDDGNDTAISVSDIDAGPANVAVTLTLTNGRMTLSGTSGLTFDAGDGTADLTMTFRGSLADVNAALDGATYSPFSGYGLVFLEVLTDDLGHTGAGGSQTDSETVQLTVRRLNRAPVQVLPSAQTVDEDTDLVFSAGNGNLIEVTDSDAAAYGAVVDTALSVDEGVLSLSRTTGLTFLDGTGNDAQEIHVEGTLDDLNAALAGLSYAAPLNWSGTDELEITTDDRGSCCVGGAQTDSDSLAITVTAVNDAPSASAPASATVAEDGALTFTSGTLLTVGDVDAGGAGVTVEVSVSHGTFALGGTTGVTVTGDGSSQVTVEGTVAAVNTALAGSTFVPAADYAGPATLTLDVSDGGNTGTGGTKTATDSTAITVSAVNDAPVVTAPVNASVDQDGSRTFGAGAISVADVDADGDDVVVDLEVTAGALTLSGTTGLAFAEGDGAGDALVSFSGTLAAVNTALDGLVYEPDSGYHGADALDIDVDDQGNNGTGGAQTASESVAITVVETNTAPVNTVPGAQTLDEDTTKTFAGASRLAVSDVNVDAASGELEVDLGVDLGRLTLDGTTGLTFTVGDGSNDTDLTFRGSPDAINAALDGMTYGAGADTNGSGTLTIVTDDLGETGPPGALTDTDTVALTITSVNDAPELTTPASVTLDEDSSVAVTGVSIADVDAGGDDLEVSLEVDQGTLTLGTTQGLSFSAGDGTDDAALTVRGSRAQLNTALATLSYAGAANHAGSDALDVEVSDLGSTGSGGAQTDSDSVDVTVSAVNDAPEITAPASVTADEDVAKAITGVSIADVDSGSADLELSLEVDDGTLTLGTTTGLAFTAGDGTDDAAIVAEGTRAELNTALATLSYRADADYSGSDALDVEVDDQGNTGSGGAKTDSATVDITVTAVNDAPVLTAPASLNPDEDVAEAVTGVSIADADAGSSDIEVSLEVGQGTLTLGTTTGLAFTTGDGTNDAAIVAEGSRSELDDALATLTYRGSSNYSGSDDLDIEVDDQGSTGPGAKTDSATVDITVAAVNDAPVNTLPGAQTMTAGTTLALDGADAISVADVDATQLEVTLTPTHGTVSAGGASTIELNLQGSTASVNQTLAELEYEPAAGYDGPAKITVVTTDNGATGSGGTLTDTDELAITVAPANEPPVVTVPGPRTLIEDSSTPVAGVSVVDADAGTDELELSLTVDHGGVSLGLAGLDVVTGDGSNDAEFVATGTLAELNSAISSLAYQGDPDFFGSDTLIVEVTDSGGPSGGAAKSDSEQVAITVDPVNDAPSFTRGPSRAYLNKDENGAPIAHSIDPWATAVTAGPNESGQALTFEIVSNDTPALFTVQPAVSATGVLTFTTDPAQSGTASLTVRLIDDGGIADGGVDTSSTQAFTIQTAASVPVLDAVSPSPLMVGASATLTGSGFSATAANNTVTVGGARATVTGATPTSLTVTVPCAATDAAAPVKVTVAGAASQVVTAPLQGAITRDLEVGESVIVEDASQVACNELASADGHAKYIVSVFSNSTSPSSNAPFQFSGDPTAPDVDVPVLGKRGLEEPIAADAGHDGHDHLDLEEHADDTEHLDLLQKNREQYRVLRQEFGTDGVEHRRSQRRAPEPTTRTFRVSNINATSPATICSSYYVVEATKVYDNGKLAIYEDNATPDAFKSSLNPTMAGYYQQIGDQFNADMEPIIRNNFGDILLRDAVTDNNGKLIALSTPRINTSFTNVAGFVVSCDQFPNDDASTPAVGGPYTGSAGSTNGASNFGEFFYMYQPVVNATGYSGNTPDNWYRTVRSTFIHESKHVASQAARVANNAPALEAPWLEEGTARLSEELWGRQAVYGPLAWKGNHGFGSASAPGNLYCDLRPSGSPECSANPRGPAQVMLRHFNPLYTHLFGQNARLLSPFGATASDNASYWYAVSWSLIRYAVDRYGTSEADFLTALNQSTTQGATNLAGRSGVSLDRLLGGWNLALAADDYPGLSNADPDSQFATWNLRAIYQGFHTDPNASGFTEAYPQIPTSFAFGAPFTATAITTIRGGGSLWYQITGTQTAPQVLRLTGNGGGALPSSVRLAVVRVE